MSAADQPRPPRGGPVITVNGLREHMLAAADDLDLPLSVAQVSRLAARVAIRAAHAPLPGLSITPHQHDILVGLAAGEAAEETAARLGVTVHTVKSHRMRMYQLLGAVNGPHAVALAHARGILQPAPVLKADQEKDTRDGSRPAAGESTRGFFKSRRTYQYRQWTFCCAAVTTSPVGEKVALGWLRFRQGDWHLFEATAAQWAGGCWRDVTKGGS